MHERVDHASGDSATFVLERTTLPELPDSSISDHDVPKPAPTVPAVIERQRFRFERIDDVETYDVANGWYCRHGKRLFDIVAGSILMLMFLPFILVAWIAVRLTSPGPAILRQQRVGLNGDCATIFKLRSMYIDHADRIDMKMIREMEERGEVYKSNRDPRVTPVGRIIRKTSIDEMPQIFNVIRGDMSLVGPRPLVPHMLELYDEVKRYRSLVRPGITGQWQVSNRQDNGSVLGMIEHDFEYVENCSFWLDLRILLKTPLAVITASGAQ